MTIDEAKELVIDAGIRLGRSGLTARTWGNISCRIDDTSFIVTPSGMTYESIKKEDLVLVTIQNLKHTGNRIPSSEMGIHGEVYRLFPEMNFAMHTHQEYASIVASSVLNSVNLEAYDPYFKTEMLFSKYALPSTKMLHKNVGKSIACAEAKIVIMKNHGTFCFGCDCDSTFKVAMDLEEACKKLIIDTYLKESKKSKFDIIEMSKFAIKKSIRDIDNYSYDNRKVLYNAKRSATGFILYNEENEIAVHRDKIDSSLPEEARIYNHIFKKHKKTNHIIFDNSPEVWAIAHGQKDFKANLDDFAQMAGIKAKNLSMDARSISHALQFSAVVFIHNMGALCCGETLFEAESTKLIIQKSSKAYIGAIILGGVHFLSPIKCVLMRAAFVTVYSKRAINS